MAVSAGRVAAVVLSTLVLLAAGCGEDSGGAETAVRVGAATVATRSFRVSAETRTFNPENVQRTLGHLEGDGVVDAANGRKRFLATGTSVPLSGGEPQPVSFESITIGPDIWTRTGHPPGGPAENLAVHRQWVHRQRGNPSTAIPGGFDPVEMLTTLEDGGVALSRLGGGTVRGVHTDHYAARLMQPTSAGVPRLHDDRFELWVDGDDLVRRIHMTAIVPGVPGASPPVPTVWNEQTVEFFDFGVQEVIEAPAADQVSEGFVPPACVGSKSSSRLPGPLDGCSPKPPELPAASVTGRSELQFRPVLAVVPGACPPLRTNPAPDEPVRLPAQEDNCYDLGPSELNVAKAAVAPVTTFDGSVAVDVTLDEGAAASFDRVAADNIGDQVAIVILGRVVSAPVVRHAEFGGRVQIFGIDAQTAADIMAALG